MRKIAFAFVVVASLAACPSENPSSKPAPAAPTAPPPPTATTPPPAPAPTATAPQAKQDPAAEAEQIFTQRCSVCHGMGGKGDGPGAAALNPKPQNYTDPKFQAEVTDDTIAKAIVEGGASVGKSPLMAPNADLKDKPDVVKALVAKVRSFKGK